MLLYLQNPNTYCVNIIKFNFDELIHQKNVKISMINSTYPYVYECIVKIVSYSSED
jgi:hypothetical protein